MLVRVLKRRQSYSVKPWRSAVTSLSKMSGAAARLLFAVTSVAFAQHGTISGTVVESNGDPVRKAVVTVTWQGQPRSWATQRTDASGKFQFENLPAGKYDLRATKAGIGTAVYGATTTHELGDVLILEDGGTLSGLKLRFIHTSSVTGRVVDAEGDPVQGANVSLMRAGRNLGQRVLVNTRQAMSNDRGEYRITGIDPGQYYLHAAIYNTGRARRLASGQFLGGATETKDRSE